MGLNFTIDMTWGRLILLSLSKKWPHNQSPDTRGANGDLASALWLQQKQNPKESIFSQENVPYTAYTAYTLTLLVNAYTVVYRPIYYFTVRASAIVICIAKIGFVGLGEKKEWTLNRVD